jgi:hypothetical protein
VWGFGILGGEWHGRPSGCSGSKLWAATERRLRRLWPAITPRRNGHWAVDQQAVAQLLLLLLGSSAAGPRARLYRLASGQHVPRPPASCRSLGLSDALKHEIDITQVRFKGYGRGPTRERAKRLRALRRSRCAVCRVSHAASVRLASCDSLVWTVCRVRALVRFRSGGSAARWAAKKVASC